MHKIFIFATFYFDFYISFILGDDMRQDQLTIQMIRIMDKLWLKEGLCFMNFLCNYLAIF